MEKILQESKGISDEGIEESEDHILSCKVSPVISPAGPLLCL